MQEAQNPTEAPVREGDVLAGKYRVEKVLGVGGMGVVVAAMHTELEERVALKFLLPAAAQNPSVVARFNREARAAAKIKSQHVARVIDVGTLEDSTPYIVMEYLDGKDLADILLEQGRLPVGVAVDYVLQAAEAIAEAHAVGIVHRDLKPPNLFLAHQSDGSSIIKVLDFGISKAAIADEPTSGRGALTGTSEIFGSPTYMSPEQLKSARDVDARADIWALGVILYELISGRAPFDHGTVPETFGAILYEQPEPLSKRMAEVPRELDQVILRCLEKDKAGRLANVAELAKALFPFAASATKASLERTSRVLRRAGVTVESIPPPSMLAGAKTNVSLPSGSQTRTDWDNQIPAPPRSRSRAPLIVGVIAGALLSGGAALLAIRQLRPTPAATVPLPVLAERPQTPATTTPAIAGTPQAATDTPAPPPPATEVAPAPTVAAAMPTIGPRGKPFPGRKGKLASPASTASAGAATTAKPVAKPPDDDFNDRK